MADRLRSAGRESAIVARLSGDEFVVMDEFSHAEQVALFAQRVLDVLKEPVVIEGLEVVTSASIGAALVQAEDTPDRVLRRADIAMYRAKARGRGCWELHDAAHDDPAVNRLRLLGELRHGIDHAELRLHYQPRIDLRTGDLEGVEALVRWQHPTRGLLPPAEFIEVAESSGLIRSLGTWVLEEAIAQAVRWRATGTGHPPVDMAVNLSTRQLTDPHLVALVTDVLARHGLDPRLLTLEITETALMEDPDAALTALTALNELGVKLAIDDFGTGYASLTYLQRFPIDEIKIDRSFVTGLGSPSRDSAIVATCIQLAHAMGIRAVAEGVETPEQKAALLDLDCHLAQGYLYARPLTPDAFATWLVHRSGAGAVNPA